MTLLYCSNIEKRDTFASLETMVGWLKDQSPLSNISQVCSEEYSVENVPQRMFSPTQLSKSSEVDCILLSLQYDNVPRNKRMRNGV